MSGVLPWKVQSVSCRPCAYTKLVRRVFWIRRLPWQSPVKDIGNMFGVAIVAYSCRVRMRSDASILELVNVEL